MFVQKLSQVTEQLRASPKNYIQNIVLHGIELWCHQLVISQDITDYILKHYQQGNGIGPITNYLWTEWQPTKKEEKNIFVQTTTSIKSTLNSLVTGVLNQIHIKSGEMEFFALIAFVLTAVGYWLYRINQPRQQSSHRETPKTHVVNPPAPLNQRVNTQFLVLVVAAEKADLIHSIKTKGSINSKDGENLYEITKYLWLGSENDFYQKISNIYDYLVSSDKKSEFDNYLVYFKLKQSDEGFEPNVGQLARYDAFRKLADLTVNFEISPRLQMEAYSNFELYSR